ncbi:MAG: hypothetical protein LUE11_06720 [Clostridia bacterium]|nr:hypothetical protein [Clostridia bacterium]
MKYIRAILPHTTIVLCILFVVLWILDYFNPMMHFLTGSLPKALMMVLLLCAAATSILTVYDQWK